MFKFCNRITDLEVGIKISNFVNNPQIFIVILLCEKGKKEEKKQQHA